MNTFAAGAPTDASQKTAAEEKLERIRSLLKVLISGLNKVLMNASLIAFPVNDLSLEILKIFKNNNVLMN